MKEKFKQDKLKFERITNDDLVCKDCMSRYADSDNSGNTSKCEEFPEVKPSSVLTGGSCEYYVKE